MKARHFTVCIALLFLIFTFALAAQRAGFSNREIQNRQDKLMKLCGDGLIILFGDTEPAPGAHFRQDNDFFYFSAVNDPNCILVMAPKSKRVCLFAPWQTDREVMVGGANLLRDEKSKARKNFDQVYRLSFFDEFLARNLARSGSRMHIRLSPRDTVDNARWESRIFVARKNRSLYNDQITLDNHRIKKLRERYPSVAMKDVTRHIDDLRVIKSAEEIAILRRNGKISARGVRQAMLATAPGVYEYELEAVAMYVVRKYGAAGPAYPPIVGSGPNSCTWHYNENSRKMASGDLVLMDFGGDLDHLCMDITRTWPVSGTFTPEQRKIYQAVLEVQKACISVYRPGVTAKDVRKKVAQILRVKGVDPMGLQGGMHHFVGMCVHDVGPQGVPLKEGMVFTIEPGLYFRDKNIGVRIEDTILITKDGCEVLSKDVPKEIDEIEKLMAQRKK
jgi:Xaa-Pro aminopeptidase